MAFKGSEWVLGMKDNVSKALSALSGAADRVSSKFVSLQDNISKFEKHQVAAMQHASTANHNFLNSFGGIGEKIAGLAAAYASFEFGKSILETTSKFQTLDNVINFTSKDAGDAAANHAFLSRIIEQYKLPILETTEGFSELNAAMMGSKLQGQGARDVFEGVAVASTAMHLSSERVSSVFLALNQMMSKGKVQAQELTLQLGQAMPGAFHLAAQAMGMAPAKFMKEMEKGNISSEVFLPRFAQTLKNTFGGAIPNAVQSLQAKMNMVNNSFINMKLVLGEALMPVIEKIIKGLTWLTSSVSRVVKFLERHSEVVKALATFIGLVATGYLLWNSCLKLNVWYNGLSTAAIILNTLVTEGATTAMVALNMAMDANPIGIIIVAVAALAAALKGLYDRYMSVINATITAGEKFKTEQLGKQVSFVRELSEHYKSLHWSNEKANKQALEDERKLVDMRIKNLTVKYIEAGLDAKANSWNPFGAQERLNKFLIIGKALEAAYAQKGDLKNVFQKITNEDKTHNVNNDLVNNISEGGKQTRNVIVNITKMVEHLNINTTMLKESNSEIKRVVEELLLRAIQGSELVLANS